MKYGQIFHAESVPQWAAFNVDYDELKNLIKVNTTRGQATATATATAIAIPGQIDPNLERFEIAFYNELSNQHDRVELFVKSKADEISRRLQHLQKVVLRLLAQTTRSDIDISQKSRDKFARYNVQIESCGDDIRDLQRFVSAQKVAFHKILKKYEKWTGSRALPERFNYEVLGSPKSLVRRDFGTLLSQYQDLAINLRSSTPAASEPPSPGSSRRASRRSSTQIPIPQPVHGGYWNEYDNPSDGGEDEPYTIYIDPSEGSFPGAKTIGYVLAKVKRPMESVKAWFIPSTSPGELRCLLMDRNDGYFADQQSGIDTDFEDDAYASSNNEFPAGYTAHYATFPSINDQQFSRHREKFLFRGMLGAFVGSLMLIMITGILVSTGRHKLRAEVDAGAIAGCITSVCFALAAITAYLCRKQRLSWLHTICVGVMFAGLLIFNLMLLFLVLDNIRG